MLHMPINICNRGIASWKPSSPYGKSRGYCNAMKEGCFSSIRISPIVLLSMTISRPFWLRLTSPTIKAAISDEVGAAYCLDRFAISFIWNSMSFSLSILSLAILNVFANGLTSSNMFIKPSTIVLSIFFFDYASVTEFILFCTSWLVSYMYN